jgi:hypothetical protein
MTNENTNPDTAEGLQTLLDHWVMNPKGYTVFNVEQIDGLSDHYYGMPRSIGHRCSVSCVAIKPTVEAPYRHAGHYQAGPERTGF